MRRISYRGLSIALSLLFVSTGTMSRAQTVIQHVGANDPTTEGWRATTGSPGSSDYSAGPVTNDLGSGIDAWSTSINIPGTGNSYAYYNSYLADNTLLKNAVLKGWDFQMNVRVVTVPKTPDYAINGVVRIPTALQGVFNSPTNPQYFQILLGSQANGDPIAEIGGYKNFTTIDLNGVGSGYHLYDLRWSPVTASADFYVDGTKYLSGITGDPLGLSLISWGSNDALGKETGQGNFNFVQFSVVPEPSTLALLILGAVGLCYNRRLIFSRANIYTESGFSEQNRLFMQSR
jgi:hypothetical protein